MIRVADYIIQRLVEEGAKHLFMVTGRGVLFLSDAAAKNKELKCISVHHEQAGAYAAMAYAQYNEKIGACLVSTGCAGTNALTPVLCAWQDEVPMIVISGQNMLAETVTYTSLPVRTFGQQEANIVEIVKPITKYATMLTKADDIGLVLDKAFHEATTGRKGPVWMDIPLDLQNARIEPSELKRQEFPKNNYKISIQDLEQIKEGLNNSSRPIILIGSSIRSSASIDLLKSFVEKYKYPVVFTNSSVDIYGSGNPLSMGVVGIMACNRAANFAVQNADFVLVLGNRLTAMATGSSKEKFARSAKIYTVDIDKNEHKKGNIKVDKSFIADVKDVLLKLNSEPLKKTSEKWQKKCLEWKELFPNCEDCYKTKGAVDLYVLADYFSNTMASDDVLVTDAGLEELILPSNVIFREHQRAIHPVNQGAMGYALPAAVGVYYSSGKNIITVIGDGSVMMNLQELQTVKYNNIALKIIIINNNCYAVIRQRQNDLFKTRTIGTDYSNGISCPDFEKIANSFGIKYLRINTVEELHLLDEKLHQNIPIICEIMGKENQKYLHSSFRKGISGKFVQPPLEDQSPFLDRDLFLSQMIIEPIDL
jgi:acetolactate synthase-1/2/3 large subunit